MANTEAEYEQDLQNIRNAIYGKDVREAMADALDYVHDTSSISGLNLKMDKLGPTGTGMISLGTDCTASGVQSAAIGSNCKSTANYTYTLGVNLINNTMYSTVVGKNNDNTEANTLFVVGAGADSANRANAFVVNNSGWTVVHKKLFAENDFVLQTDSCKISMLREPDTTAGMYSVTLGQRNTASNNHAMAIGYRNAATGVESFAGGYECQSKHDQSFAFGIALNTARNRQFVIGEYNVTDGDALFVVGNGTSSIKSNAFVVKNTGDTVCNGGLYSTVKVDAPLVNCTTCTASSVTASELNATDDVNIVDDNGNVEFSVRDFREAADNYVLAINLSIGDRDVSDPFTNADLLQCEYLAGLTGVGHQHTPSELYSLYEDGAVVRMNISRGNGRVLSFTLNDAGPLGTNGQLNFMFSKNGLGSISTITLISNSEQTHYTQEIYTNN